MTSPNSQLAGKVCLITGASGGIGKAAAIELAQMGAALVLVCRDRNRGEAAVTEISERSGNRDIEMMLADLSSQAQIRRLVREFLAADRPLHVLLNNAGLMLTTRTQTVDGIETTFAVNHLAYFLLTNLLRERLTASAPARVVNVASDAYRFARGRIDLDDVNGERRYSGMRNYGQSKLANILFTRELARRLAGTGVTANCLHPGTVATGFGRNNGGFMKWGMRIISPFIRTPDKGAQTAVYLCASPALEGVSGKYFHNKREKRLNRAAENDADAQRLWELSARMTGVEQLQSENICESRVES